MKNIKNHNKVNNMNDTKNETVIQREQFVLNKEVRATKAVICARVSSKQQQDGYSLEAQENNCRNYCMQQGLEILAVYVLVESSTRGGRKKFHEMLDFVAKQKESIAIVCDNLDRFQRSFRETLELDPLLKAGKVELHFLTQNLAIHKNTPAGEQMRWSIGVSLAENYVLSLRDNTKRGLQQKVRNGEFPSKAPIGYKNVTLNGTAHTIVIDEDTAPLVKKLFEQYATGVYSLRQAVSDFKKANIVSCRGVPFNAASMQRTISNPFYYGVMRVKGQLIPHIYPPLITKELFDQCQKVRFGYQREKVIYDGKMFVFKGIMKCKKCGRYISCYERNKKNKRNDNVHHYIYLRCAGRAKGSGCTTENIREEEVLAQVTDCLKKLKMPADLLKHSFNMLVEKIGTQANVLKATDNNINRRLGQIAKEKEVWVQKEASGLLDSETVNANLKTLAEEEEKLKKRKETADKITVTDVWTLERVINLASRLPELFAGSHPAQKRKILRLISANLFLDEKNVEIIMKKPFSLMAEGSRCIIWGG